MQLHIHYQRPYITSVYRELPKSPPIILQIQHVRILNSSNNLLS